MHFKSLTPKELPFSLRKKGIISLFEFSEHGLTNAYAAKKLFTSLKIELPTLSYPETPFFLSWTLTTYKINHLIVLIFKRACQYLTNAHCLPVQSSAAKKKKKITDFLFSLVNGHGKQGRKEENFFVNNYSYFKFAHKERHRNLWGSNSKVWPCRLVATTVIAMDFLRAGVCFSHPSYYDLGPLSGCRRKFYLFQINWKQLQKAQAIRML